MIFSLVITEEAESDLRQIFDYYANELEYPDVAVAIVRNLREVADDICFMPNRFRLWPLPPESPLQIRCYQHRSYVFVFTVDEESSTVTLLSVVNHARNIQAFLERNFS